MAGPGGREVGRLAIRVLPATDGFAARTQTFLDRIEARAQVKVSVLPDVSRFAPELRADLDRTKRTIKGVRVPVTPDMTRFAADLRRGLAMVKAKVLVRLAIAPGEVTRLRAELAGIRPRPVVTVDVQADRSGLNRLGASLSNLGGSGAGLGSLMGSLGQLTSVASAVPAVVSLLSSLAQMAPAAGIAAPALLAVGAAGAAIKIGMSGVAAALKGDADAMAKLAPSARAFVAEVQALKPAWQGLQTSVQGALFKGLGDDLARTASSVLPVLRTGLTGAAGALNQMAAGAMNAVKTLASNGTLGQALSGATAGLRNLSGLPAVLIKGLTQIGAAAAPAFQRLTASAGTALQSLSQKMTGAFNSGAMQATIEHALAMVRTLFGTLANIGTTLGNVFGPAAAAGAGFLGVLSQIAATAARVTATPQAQATFTALFQTLSALGGVISGTLGAALRAVMPLLNSLVANLAGPIQTLAATVGPILARLAAQLGTALGPVVSSLSSALGSILPIIGQLVGQLAGALGPVLIRVGALIGQLVNTLMGALKPILAQLPAIIGPILSIASQLLGIIFKIAGQLIAALAPALATIGGALGQLMKALGPLVTALGSALMGALKALMPVITPIISIIGKLAGILAGLLASQIKNIVVPAIHLITNLLRGDFSGAIQSAKQLLTGIKDHFGTIFKAIGQIVLLGIGKILPLFARLALQAPGFILRMGPKLFAFAGAAMQQMGASLRAHAPQIMAFFASIPGRALRALGNLGGYLVNAGRQLLGGFISGITSRISGVKNTLQNLTHSLTSWKGPPSVDRRILTPNGRLVMQGFMSGISDQVPLLRRQLGGITDNFSMWVGGSAAMGPEHVPVRSGLGVVGPAGGGASVQIENFHAGGISPQQVARELEWRMKARG
ncbi:hypothetical protein ACFWJW_00675 [Streptomyces sp. NPDC127097]|uniref:phage tail protein n=1 Tax=Streptomyces sp. NPDC127097 TaxID=3347136 RepID=UPI0036527A5B